MPQLRKDPVTGRWIIVETEKPLGKEALKSHPHEKSSKTCPFCPGNESMTPPEIASYPAKGAAKDRGPWQVRVVPNKFPALRIEESTEKAAIGIYDKVGGFGAHEVIVENPGHGTEISDASAEEVELLLRVYRDRCLDLQKDRRFKYILIFKNYGAAAGASLEHPHSQLIALPVVPSRVQGEVKGSAEHFAYTDRCIFCDMLDQEYRSRKLTVFDGGDFLAMAPFASRLPFETWILPKSHESSYSLVSDDRLKSLAVTVKTTFLKIKKALNDPPFNFMIHTLPPHVKEEHSFHWHLEIIPHLTEVSGFELGTGFYLNVTPPELAAETLRNEPV
ncbi:MAG: DUF4931 domain-containing protein [Candidatus Omnitrophica bacterium]|nr:DUF4931 domain-containing protein [Candidatus Omnitrophota bacterium]